MPYKPTPNPFSWVTGFQFAWIALLALKLLDVLPLPWWLLLSPIWAPLALLLALEARLALTDAWEQRRSNRRRSS